MNKLILSFIAFIILLGNPAFGQDPACIPDETYADSLAGVYPGPYHEVDFPNGGIQEIACINQDFEVVLTAVIRDSISYGGFDFKLNHMKILENGIVGLPDGLDYACNPPSCFFESNTLGCLVISGIPTEGNQAGAYDLKLVSEIMAADGLILIQDTLPQFLVPGSHYYLHLYEENSPECIISTEDIGSGIYEFELLRNPVVEGLHLTLKLASGLDWQVEVVNMDGKIIAREPGKGSIDDMYIHLGSELTAGYYFVRLSTAKTVLTRKFVILAD